MMYPASIFISFAIGLFGNQLTVYVPNDGKYIAARERLRECIQETLDTDYYGLDRIRHNMQWCHDAFWESNQQSPDFIYTAAESVTSKYEEFDLCAFGLASPMWDFPPETTTEDFRKSVQNCVDSYPQ